MALTAWIGTFAVLSTHSSRSGKRIMPTRQEISKIVSVQVAPERLFQFLSDDEILRQGTFSEQHKPEMFSIWFGHCKYGIEMTCTLHEVQSGVTELHYKIRYYPWASPFFAKIMAWPEPTIIAERVEECCRSIVMPPLSSSSVNESTLCQVMGQAWQDHHHTRDQTWKALQAEFVIAAAVVGLNWKTGSVFIAAISSAVLFIVALCGVQITLRHRNRVELDKFRHIMHCEKALGLHRSELIDGTKMPRPISSLDVFNPFKANTALFILRMHITVLVLSLLCISYCAFCRKDPSQSAPKEPSSETSMMLNQTPSLTRDRYTPSITSTIVSGANFVLTDS